MALDQISSHTYTGIKVGSKKAKTSFNIKKYLQKGTNATHKVSHKNLKENKHKYL